MAADAKTVMELRDRTGAGVMDCKAALQAGRRRMDQDRAPAHAWRRFRSSYFMATGTSRSIRATAKSAPARSRLYQGMDEEIKPWGFAANPASWNRRSGARPTAICFAFGAGTGARDFGHAGSNGDVPYGKS